MKNLTDIDLLDRINDDAQDGQFNTPYWEEYKRRKQPPRGILSTIINWIFK